MNLRRFVRNPVWPLMAIAVCGGCATHSIHVTHNDQKFEAGINGRTMVTYQLKAPAGAGLPVESGGFFHPVTTPSGVVVTDLAPADHRHHRGVFLAWVEMHGRKDADFWVGANTRRSKNDESSISGCIRALRMTLFCSARTTPGKRRVHC